jgi:hypothetical protein
MKAMSNDEDPMDVDVPAPQVSPPRPIEPLKNLAPAIFVPLTEDLTKDFARPPNRVSRLREILNNVERHSEGVHSLLRYLFEREKTRLLQDAQKAETQAAPVRVSPAELDDLILRMEAKHELGKAYTASVATFQPNFYVKPPWEETPQELQFRLIMKLVEDSLMELKEHKRHAEEIKDFYREALKRDLAREFEFAALSQAPKAV